MPYFPYEQVPLYPGGLARLHQEIGQHLRRVHELSRLYVPVPIVLRASFLLNSDGHPSEPRLEVPSHLPALG